MSDRASQLRTVVAEFFEVDEGRVVPSFPLNGPRGSSSIARASLDAAILRRAGVRIDTVYTAKTYGELAGQLADGAVPAATNGHAPSSSLSPSPATANGPSFEETEGQGGVSCGIDIETVSSLPETADHWDDPFYRTTFSPSEIAYCLAQEEPRRHFAARWCAKEALRKCDGRFLSADLRDLEVVADEAGKPYFARRSGDQRSRLPHALSLSHAADAAVAVVILESRPSLPPPPAGPAPVATPAPPAPVIVQKVSRSGFSTLLSLAALASSLFAIYRTWPR